ncbi:translation initiation factor IF-2 subunit gamma [Desulfurococcaceae archaeon AG1]|jgi:translation initiation factor 2 subunit 3|nr:MAG: translation initiation factor IF-2 subunit gamma [Desulfurococcaceae archaeon]GAY26492.1 translation initiation factor IF-2 subunit gamma [Desulfurococcaceae archaeon AG1]
MWKITQPEVNIGVVGHVDHGKTTLVQALTGIWTARHSMELRRSMTIKLGYADGNIAYCDGLEEPDAYTTTSRCPDNTESRLIRRVSYVDSPGHETLMATMLSGAALMDGALLVIAANEPCPQPQTREHLTALKLVGIKNIVVIQNKIDVVDKERALESYNEIKSFLSEMGYEKAPIIPVSALHGVNIDAVLMAIQRNIPTPERDTSADPLMFVARSFEVNKVGTPVSELVGGIVGGSLIQGVIRVGDEIEIKPGVRIERADGKAEYVPLTTRVTSIRFGTTEFNEARPGGLVALGTDLDPFLTKADKLVGNIVGKAGRVPDPLTTLEMDYILLERVVGAKEMIGIEPIRVRENIMLTIGTNTTMGIVNRVSKDRLEVTLIRPSVVIKNMGIAISRQIKGRWRLVGYAKPII